MIVNLKSAREMKPNILNKGKMILNSAKMTLLNSRNQSNTKYTKTTKIIKSNNSKEKIKKTKKTIVNNKNSKISQKKILLIAEREMISNLKKYNMTIETYNKKVITDIIYDERKHIVSVFKNYLLWDEMSDFLKRFYYKHESKNRLPKINHYYEKYTLFPPVYFPLEDVIKIMLKNVKRKKKYLEMIEENEDNMCGNNNKKKENKEFNRIINPSDISQTMSLKTYKNNDLTNTISSLNYENENNSKDLGQLINKFINDCDVSYFNDTFLKNKNNSHEIIKNNLDIQSSIFKLDDSEIEKKDYKVDNENLEQKIDKNNKTKLPMTGKVLEIKKLNFENINKNSNNNENLDSNNKNVIIKEKIKKTNNSDRQKICNYYSLSNLTNVKSSNIKKKLNKNKYNFPNNLLFTQKLLSTTRDSKKTINNEKTNKSLESLLKIIQYPKQLSPRAKTNSNTQNKVIKHKRKTNLVIQTNSNKNTISSRINTSQNKKDNKSNTENNSKKKNINNNNIITPKFITNNNITSKIYNINLNLNIGNNKKKNLTQNPNSNFNKKQSKNITNKYNNIRNILYGNSSIPISNNPNSQFSNLFKTKNINIEQKKNPESKRKDGKISYDLNSNGNNVHISIHKQTASNTNNNNNSNSNTQPSVNININCQNNTNNLIEKKVSRNEKNVLSNLQSNSIKGKHLVIQLGENNTSIKKKNKTKKNYNNYGNDLINALYHDTSMSIGKLKKKLNIQINKKYPLTSRNEKDIPSNIINKLLSKLK